MWLGLAAWRLGRYQLAREEGERSLAMKRRLGLDDELSRSYNALGLLAWNEGRELEAVRDFDSAVATARRVGDLAGVARASANLPLVQVELGNYDATRDDLALALTAANKLGDAKIVGNALVNLAMLNIRLGKAAAALPLLDEARKHYDTVGYKTGESNALGQRATAWSELGDLARAEASADTALTIARSQGLEQEVAGLLEVEADLREQAGNPRAALQTLIEADSLDSAMGLTVERGINLRRTGAILLDLGEAAAALSRARSALAIHDAAHERGEVVYDRVLFALAMSRTGDLRAASAEADSANREAASLRNPSLVTEAAAASARIALDGHDPTHALALLTSAPASDTLDWRLADLRAEALYAQHRLAEAKGAEELAIAIMERERHSLGRLAQSAHLIARTAPFYRLVAIDLARGDTVGALAVAAFVPGRGLPSHHTVRDDLAQRVDALERQIAELPQSSQNAEQRAALTQALVGARAAYRPVTFTPSLLEHQLRVHLEPNEALLTFLVGPDRIDAFVVRASAMRSYSVALGQRALRERIRAVRALLDANQPPADLTTALGELNEQLIGPAIRSGVLSGVTTLFILPHDVLAALPFAALWNPSPGRFLVEDMSVTYLSSAAPIHEPSMLRRSPRAYRDFEVFAPLPDSLPGTAREARAIAQIVGGATVRIGTASTEGALRSALAAGHPIHIASHATHNEDDPLFSRMIVGRPGRVESDTATANDGLLETRELIAMHTTSPLVFLSGCESGLITDASPFSRNLEESSLAEGFLAAGAETVIATLWRAEDARAVDIAAAFYRELVSGVRPAEALARAQRASIRRTGRSGLAWAAYAVWSRTGANME